MAFKRKRSMSELSSSPLRPSTADQSAGSSPANTFTFHLNSASSPTPTLGSAMTSPSHLPSRTFKRFRDSRPSENEVHQRTLGILYEAQRHPHHEQQPQSREQNFDPNAPVAVFPGASRSLRQVGPQPAQRSLHSFWSISSAPSAGSSPPVDRSMAASPGTCGDCGVDLPASDPDAMDIEGYGAGNACNACGKGVCGHCSVTDVDGRRSCLGCGARRTGAMGWTAAQGVVAY